MRNPRANIRNRIKIMTNSVTQVLYEVASKEKKEVKEGRRSTSDLDLWETEGSENVNLTALVITVSPNGSGSRTKAGCQGRWTMRYNFYALFRSEFRHKIKAC